MRKTKALQVGLLILMTTIFLAVCQIVLAESTGSAYRQAIAAFDAHHWTTAVEQFKLVYQRDPASSEAEDSLFFWGEQGEFSWGGIRASAVAETRLGGGGDGLCSMR